MQRPAVNRSEHLNMHELVRRPRRDGGAARGRAPDRTTHAPASGHCLCSSSVSAITVIGRPTHTAASKRRMHGRDGA
jgi:hypothetical protein